MIKIKGLNKIYTTGTNQLHVLKDIDMHIEKGEFISIMGSSGSGKSTLLNIIGLLDEYDTGEYYLNGTRIEKMSEAKSANLRRYVRSLIPKELATLLRKRSGAKRESVPPM